MIVFYVEKKQGKLIDDIGYSNLLFFLQFVGKMDLIYHPNAPPYIRDAKWGNFFPDPSDHLSSLKYLLLYYQLHNFYFHIFRHEINAVLCTLLLFISHNLTSNHKKKGFLVSRYISQLCGSHQHHADLTVIKPFRHWLKSVMSLFSQYTHVRDQRAIVIHWFY